MDREARIKKLAQRYEQSSSMSEQEAWEKAVQKVEREGSENSRGPVRPDPQVGSKGDTDHEDALHRPDK
jgi:hypothetical protein